MPLVLVGQCELALANPMDELNARKRCRRGSGLSDAGWLDVIASREDVPTLSKLTAPGSLRSL
jgi:hypothetical protein